MLRAAIFGFAFGSLLAVFGLFVGLQVHPDLGTLMLFPSPLLASATGVPFGRASGALRLLYLALPGLFWAGSFAAVAWRRNRLRGD